MTYVDLILFPNIYHVNYITNNIFIHFTATIKQIILAILEALISDYGTAIVGTGVSIPRFASFFYILFRMKLRNRSPSSDCEHYKMSIAQPRS